MIYFPKRVLTLLQNPHTNKSDNTGGGPGSTIFVATQAPLTTCYPANPHLSHTTPTLVDGSAWAITHLPQSLGMVPL